MPSAPPAAAGPSHATSARMLRPEMAAAIDAWAASQPDRPARPEAIRRLISAAIDRA